MVRKYFGTEGIRGDAPFILHPDGLGWLYAPTGVVVRWRTNIASDSRVAFGLAPGSLATQADDSTVTTEHVVALAGLSPATSYTRMVRFSLSST